MHRNHADATDCGLIGEAGAPTARSNLIELGKGTEDDKESISTIADLKTLYPDFLLWAGLVVASAIFFWLSLGTQRYPPAIGLLTSSVSLLMLMAFFEVAWQAAIHVLRVLGITVET